VNALAMSDVGKYLNDYFVSSFQKVGTFRKVGQQKQGGNVASYFCTTEGQVLHVIAGPVDAATMLREARWVVETRKLGLFECKGDEEGLPFKRFFRKAHQERLSHEYGMMLDLRQQPMTFKEPPPAKPHGMHQRVHKHAWGNMGRALDKRGQAHVLLARYPLVPIEKIYKLVFEQILNQRVTTVPVQEAG
jgi:hypothetical protein